MEETRVCTRCGIEKNISCFRKSFNKTYNKYYYRSYCHDCELEYSRKYELTRPERKEYNKVKNKEYRETHKEELRDYNKKYREEHFEEIQKQRKEYYENNREKVIEQRKKYYNKNKDKIIEYHHRYNRENSKMLVEKAGIYQKHRVETDEFYRFKRLIRDCVLKSFKRTNHRKSSYAREIIGIDFDQAWEYLKNTWKKNYGKEYNGELYHIDHIIPLSIAKTEEDVIKLCHYTNLQLLKPEDNLEKSDKLDYIISDKEG